MTKNIKRFALGLGILLCSVTLAGCKKDKTPTTEDEKTIRISYTLAGFGDEWINQAVSLFNKTFESQGYVAVVERCDPNASETAKNEIKYPDDNKFDLYFDLGASIVRDAIDSSYSVLKTRDKVLLEDLTSLYNSHPIDTKGNEESDLISDNISVDSQSYARYTANEGSKFYNKIYSYQWTSAYAGFAMNKKVLASFGFEAPRTTLEMQNICEQVLKANKKASNGNTIYPMTWPGQNAAGYLAYAYETWVAQWMGIEGYNNFYALNPANGNTKEKGYEVYNNEGILHALTAANTFINRDYACNGTVTTINHLTSEQILADGEALFAVTGDWCYNELINCDYSEKELEDIVMMATPVLSDIATQINLPGKTLEEQDKVLSNIIKAIDEGKTDAEIKNGMSDVTIEQITKIREARGLYYDEGLTHQAYIPSYANAKEGAILFLRFIASKDFAQTIYARYAHGVTANRNASVTGSNFTNSVASITKQPYSYAIGSAYHLSQIRMSGAISFTYEPIMSWADMFKGMANRVDGYNPTQIYEKVRDGMEKNWDSIIISSGLYD